MSCSPEIYTTLGTSTRLVTLPFIERQFASLGLSSNQTATLLKALCIQPVRVGPLHYIDLLSLQIAFRIAFRAGRPNPFPDDPLTPEEIDTYREAALEEMLLAQSLRGIRSIRHEMKQAAKSIGELHIKPRTL